MGKRVHPTMEWQERLEAAGSVDEVVEAAHDFVGRFAPSMLAQLPRGCLPPINLDAAAISDYALELVRHELSQGGDAAAVLSAFSLFFTDASQAIARIAMARTRRDGWEYVRR